MTLFADKTQVVTELRADRLLLAGRSYFSASTLSEDYIYGKLLAAEAEISRRLRVLLEPTIVFAGPPTSEEIAAAGAAPWIEEPAYDFDPDMYTGDRWSLIPTRQRPIIAVQSFAFVYPTPITSRFNVPQEWLRIDKKYGQIRVVPSGVAASSPVALYLMQSMGGGRGVPQMIHIRYTAGLVNAGRDYPDLIDLIKKLATLKIMEDAFVPQSGSISADGLSQSSSMDLSKYHDAVDAKIEVLRQSLNGIRMMVM